MRKQSLKEIFESKIYYGLDGCHHWLGCLGVSCKKGGKKDRAKINVNGVQKYAARISYELYRGPIPKGKLVLHTCDNPACVNPDHLYLGTNFDNMRDRAVRDRFGKVKSDDVSLIIRMYNAGIYQWEIAKYFGISQGNVSMIVNRKSKIHAIKDHQQVTI